MVVLVGLSVAYLLQALSPIRLDNDSVVYLYMATNIADGKPFADTGLPIGYPAFVALLDSIGLGAAWVFVLANCAFTAVGLASAHYCFQRRQPARQSWVVPLSMLAMPVIRYLPVPLPEAMFFGVSLGAVAAMSAALDARMRSRQIALIAIALAATGAAISVRMVGVALLPALLWTLIRTATRGSPSSAAARKFAWISLAATAVVVLMVALVPLRDSFRKYSSESMLMYLHEDRGQQAIVHLTAVVRTFGEIVLNLPFLQFPDFRGVFILAGLVGLIVVAGVFRLSLPRTPPAIYLSCFLALLIFWPYTAVRLWQPVVPLIIGYVELAPLRFAPRRWWVMLRRLHAAGFVLAGLGALAYTSRITFSGSNFPKVYGKAGGMSVPDRAGRIDTLHNARARELMQRYGNPF